MAKALSDTMLDLMLDVFRARVTRINVDSTQPTTYAEAITTYKLATTTLTSTDLSIGDGDTSGRKFTVAAKSGLTIDTTGTAAHVSLTGSTGSTVLLLVTTCTTIALTTGNTVNVPVWDFEIRDVA